MNAPLLHILLVEDETRHQQIYAETINQALGAQVSFATSGPKALEALAGAELPDLVLLDLDIPGIPGAEVLARIKTDPRLRHLPVIILTGHAGLELQMELLDSGADDFIEKGGPPSVLLARLKTQLRHKLAVDRLERMALDRDLFAAGVLQDISTSKWTVVALCRAAKDALRRDPVGEKAEILKTLEKLAAHAAKVGAYATDVIQSVRETHRDPTISPQEIGPLLDWVIEVLAGPVGGREGDNLLAARPGAPATPILWQAPAALQPVLADRSFFRLALLNVVQAALKRARPGQPLTVTVTQAAHTNPEDPLGRRFLATHLADDGAELSARELTQVFQPGASLGMALVAKVMARMGGRVWAESDRSGGAVILDLPAG